MFRSPRLSIVFLIITAAACRASAPLPAEPAAASPASPQTSPPSAAPVGYATFTVARPGRELPAAIWYPAQAPVTTAPVRYHGVPGDAFPDAPRAAGGPFPVVVLSHGSGGVKESAAYLGERLAAAGYLVAAVDHVGDTFTTIDLARRQEITRERPRDVSALLDALAAPPAGAPAALAGAADLDRVGVYGHSFGGYTALALAGAPMGPTATWRALCAEHPDAFECALLDPAQPAPLRLRDARVDAVVGAAPAGWGIFDGDGAAAIETPVLLLAGGKDVQIELATRVQPVYDHLRTPRWLVDLELGTHWTFIDICPFVDHLPAFWQTEVRPQCAPDAPLSMPAARRLIADAVVAFFDATLRGDRDAAAALAPDRLRARAAQDRIAVDVKVAGALR